MDQKNITLELLVRSGNPEGVEQFTESEGFDEFRRTVKITEAGVYSAIKSMWEEAEGGIDSREICHLLNQNKFTNYFSTINNTEVLGGIVDVLQAGTQANMEAYAQITAIDVLGVESVAGAIRRNIDAPNMREKVTKLVQKGYSLVFCPHDIDAEMVDHYFPIIDKWREFVNPQKVAQQAIRDIAEDIVDEEEDLFNSDNRYKKDFVYKSMDKLVELTDRETVSRLVYECFGDSDNYQKFICDGKVDAYMQVAKPKESANPNLDKALQKYERSRFPLSWNVTDLAKAVGDDHKVARRVVGEGIAEASKAGNLTRLGWVLDLPHHLIDETNSAISGVVTAYKISQQIKGQK